MRRGFLEQGRERAACREKPATTAAAKHALEERLECGSPVSAEEQPEHSSPDSTAISGSGGASDSEDPVLEGCTGGMPSAAMQPGRVRWIALTGEGQHGWPVPATGGKVASSSSSASSSRRPMDFASLEQALQIAEQSAAAEREGLGDWPDNTWEEAVRLRHYMWLVAQPDFEPPPNFQQAMVACASCLLNAQEGHLQNPATMAEFLQSSEVQPIARYLDWLERAFPEVVAQVTPKSGPSCRTVLVPTRVRSALSSWPSECALLRQSAMGLWEALLAHGPSHLRSCSALRSDLEQRQAMHEAQTGECMRVAQELEEAASAFKKQLEQESGAADWPKLARMSQNALRGIQRLATGSLASHKEKWQQSLEEYEALGARSSSSRAAVAEARRHVRRHEQALGQTAQRFTEFANQLVAWTGILLPKLRLLANCREELQEAIELRQRLPALESELLEAEDELDVAVTELRKHRRHAQASRARAPVDSAACAVLTQQSELRNKHAEERVSILTAELKETEARLYELEKLLPLTLDPDDLADPGDASEHYGMTAEERLALKLAELQHFHEEIAVQSSMTVAERVAECEEQQTTIADLGARVEERRSDEALRHRIEPGFMCPIMHERMSEPVLAADGHTYEKQAIQRWLQLHNTSPMTGAPLAHRYLTENFALRHLIASYEEEQGSTRNREQEGEAGLDEDEDDLESSSQFSDQS
eukprot:gnl/TRDRNA2_/TRDRNA2_40440_c0_seq1.p1 gnl/TRDRNA2_/TRDRNA2_40440_c0~~gnl/TRDRNA2_/TRDRNA2_40440_c0_seq1.p1  ORF type:complete len:707 (-),score=155.00 gnl/TRDRNA2_/TRDRNA2_40440_c0_seq1:30-2150(-)